MDWSHSQIAQPLINCIPLDGWTWCGWCSYLWSFDHNGGAIITAICSDGAATIPTGTTGYFDEVTTPGAWALFTTEESSALEFNLQIYNPAWFGSASTLEQIALKWCRSFHRFISRLSSFTNLESLNFGPAISWNSNPLTPAACGCGCTTDGQLPIFGLEVLITGSQTDLSPDAVITVQLQLPDGTLSPTTFTIQLPSSPGTVVVGSPTELWGLTLSTSLISDPSFQVNLVASTTGGELVTFTATVQLKVFTTPNPPPDINYLKTLRRLMRPSLAFLGSDGVMYQEDVVNNPNVLTPVYTAIEPNTFAESATIDDPEFIALSNLLNGTDIPYTYDGQNFDRLSQVGPGAPPTASTSTTTIDIVSITQPTAKSDPEQPGQLSGILWSNGPGSTAPGNVLTVYYARVSAQPLADPDLQPGVGVELAGIDVPGPNNDFNGQTVDGDYLVVGIGQGVPPGAEFERWYFTVTMPST